MERREGKTLVTVRKGETLEAAFTRTRAEAEDAAFLCEIERRAGETRERMLAEMTAWRDAGPPADWLRRILGAEGER